MEYRLGLPVCLAVFGLLDRTFSLAESFFYIYIIEVPMKVSDAILEMELGGVDEADIAEIVEMCNRKGLNVELIEEELLKRGYGRIFTADYDAYDEYNEYAEWEDDEYTSVEKFPYKPSYRE